MLRTRGRRRCQPYVHRATCDGPLPWRILQNCRPLHQRLLAMRGIADKGATPTLPNPKEARATKTWAANVYTAHDKALAMQNYFTTNEAHIEPFCHQTVHHRLGGGTYRLWRMKYYNLLSRTWYSPRELYICSEGVSVYCRWRPETIKMEKFLLVPRKKPTLYAQIIDTR